MSMLGKIVAVSSVISFSALFLILQMTTPATIGPVGILFVFVFMYLSVLGLLTFFIFGVSKLLARVSKALSIKRQPSLMTINRSYYFASVIALAPVMVVGMQSVGEVGVYELLLVVLFLVIACTYISKRTN